MRTTFQNLEPMSVFTFRCDDQNILVKLTDSTYMVQEKGRWIVRSNKLPLQVYHLGNIVTQSIASTEVLSWLSNGHLEDVEVCLKQWYSSLRGEIRILIDNIPGDVNLRGKIVDAKKAIEALILFGESGYNALFK